MEKIFTKTSKLNLYAKIQKNLSKLRPNSSDDDVQEIFAQIPSTFYDEKQNLIILCQLFGIIGRCRRQMGRITTKLFENIMKYLKKDLQNESQLFWNIFGSCIYFKFWMYKEGLIDIDQIILSAQSNEKSLVAEYFLPEILEHSPESFHKEIKFKFPCFQSEESYSSEKVQSIKNLREKHLMWLKKSGDYHDDLYKEIEKNQLRLSIKTDDVSSFQKILSNSNISINSTIQESTIEHFLNIQLDMNLIEYAAIYNASNIFNFLILNGAKIEPSMLNFVIQSDNYDMFHAVEPKLKNILQSFGIQFAIISWNSDLINYVIENYGYKFLLDFEDNEEEENENGENDGENDGKDENGENDGENENGENDGKTKNGENDGKNYNRKTTKDSLIADDFFGIIEKKVIDMIENTIYSYNFSFFKSFLLPILKSNPIIIAGNYQNIITSSVINDLSFYFPNEFIRFPVYANFLYTEEVNSILVKAIEKNLVQAVEYLIQFPFVDINGMIFYACRHFSCIQIIKILSSHPNFDVNFKNSVNNIDVFKLSLINGNFYAAMFFIENFPNLEIEESFYDAYYFIKSNHLMSLKIYIKILMDKNDDEKFQHIIDEYKKVFALNHLDDSFEKKLLDTINELKSK